MNIEKIYQEHDGDNEVYISAKRELITGKEINDGVISAAGERLDKLCKMMEGIDAASGDYVEAIDLFVSFFDDVVLECAELTDRRAEIESKIIEHCKKSLTAAKTRNAKEEHVTATIIDCISAAPSAKVSKEMAAAVLDETNPLRLGLTLYEDFCNKNSLFTDVNSLDYLKAEAEARRNLIKGDDKAAFDALEKLISLPKETSEKYMLFSMNSFYHGFTDDARKSLEIGLNKFPDNPRLVSAKSALPEPRQRRSFRL
ncbi:MAG: hypothetical protein LBI27_08965 [Clostridiales bacterium]|jgi:hypothetical protein|nr:hypothetical protein [Clostridiales bacterium]